MIIKWSVIEVDNNVDCVLPSSILQSLRTEVLGSRADEIDASATSIKEGEPLVISVQNASESLQRQPLLLLCAASDDTAADALRISRPMLSRFVTALQASIDEKVIIKLEKQEKLHLSLLILAVSTTTESERNVASQVGSQAFLEHYGFAGLRVVRRGEVLPTTTKSSQSASAMIFERRIRVLHTELFLAGVVTASTVVRIVDDVAQLNGGVRSQSMLLTSSTPLTPSANGLLKFARSRSSPLTSNEKSVRSVMATRTAGSVLVRCVRRRAAVSATSGVRFVDVDAVSWTASLMLELGAFDGDWICISSPRTHRRRRARIWLGDDSVGNADSSSPCVQLSSTLMLNCGFLAASEEVELSRMSTSNAAVTMRDCVVGRYTWYVCDVTSLLADEVTIGLMSCNDELATKFDTTEALRSYFASRRPFCIGDRFSVSVYGEFRRKSCCGD
jgi:hypothetical protein